MPDEVLKQIDKGKGLSEYFSKNGIFNSNTKFHKTIRKNDCKSSMNLKIYCIFKNQQNGIQTTLEVNKNILGALNFFCFKTAIVVNHKKALEYPLNLNTLNYIPCRYAKMVK